MEFLKLVELCKDKKVWIQTHNFPDPDAIGSAFGLQELLKHYNIDTKLCYEGAIDKLSTSKMTELLKIEIFSYSEIIDEIQPTDMIILVDCQKNTGNTIDMIGHELAAIDHHPTTVQVDYEYSDIRITGACASIIAEYYKELEITPSKRAATALLYGLRMDTLQFSRGATTFDIDIFGYLFPLVEHRTINLLEKNNMELSDMQAYADSINNTEIVGKVGFSHIDFSCPDALVAILCDFLLSLVEVEVAVVYSKREDGYKFSIRSERPDVDAGYLAKTCLSGIGSGGGHSFMAGGMARKDALPNDDNAVFDFICKAFLDVIKKDYPHII